MPKVGISYPMRCLSALPDSLWEEAFHLVDALVENGFSCWEVPDVWNDYPEDERFLSKSKNELKTQYRNFQSDEAYVAFVNNDVLQHLCIYLSVRPDRSSAQRDVYLRFMEDRDPTLLEPYWQEIGYHLFLQYQLKKHWDDLKAYAQSKGLELLPHMEYCEIDYQKPGGIYVEPHLYRLKGKEPILIGEKTLWGSSCKKERRSRKCLINRIRAWKMWNERSL